MSGHVEEYVNEPHTTGVWLTIIGTFLILSIIVYFGSMYYKASASGFQSTREETGSIGTELQQQRDYEAEMSQKTEWIDKDKGTIQIPLDVAMGIVVKKYNN
ncbi:hypothetical protein EB093_01740 [bacterium]|nr:hypothetical protein [bacterium]